MKSFAEGLSGAVSGVCDGDPGRDYCVGRPACGLCAGTGICGIISVVLYPFWWSVRRLNVLLYSDNFALCSHSLISNQRTKIGV